MFLNSWLQFHGVSSLLSLSAMPIKPIFNNKYYIPTILDKNFETFYRNTIFLGYQVYSFPPLPQSMLSMLVCCENLKRKNSQRLWVTLASSLQEKSAGHKNTQPVHVIQHSVQFGKCVVCPWPSKWVSEVLEHSA